MSKSRSLPRASLVVLGFNAGAFLEESISAAFAQTYSNLEIILSDDCSTDDTFERMEAACARYSGDHTVKLNRTPFNSGTLAHVYDAAQSATGDLIVLAAADDISYPDRVERLVAAWTESGAQALFSSQDLIDERGAIVARNHRYDDSGLEWNDYFPNFVAIRGATSAYARSTFTDIPLPTARILFEDTFLALMLHLLDRKILYVDQPLVQYRVHSGAVTNADFLRLSKDELLRRERQAQSYAASMAAVLEVFDSSLRTKPRPRYLESDRRFYQFSASWLTAGFFVRFNELIAARRSKHRRWILARLFGPRFLVLLKSLRKLRGVRGSR